MSEQKTPVRSPLCVKEGEPVVPDLSIIVMTCNHRGLLDDCLTSLFEKTVRWRYEVIVMDNGSTDGTGDLLRERFPQTRHVYRPGAFSFTKSNNQGIRLSRGRYVLILNDDTKLENDAFDRVVDYFDAHPRCGVVGCKLLNGDGSLQYSCRRFPSFNTALFNRYSVLTRFFPGNPFSTNYLMTDFDHESTIEVDWVSGACLAVRREAMDEVGMLDEKITFFTEDVDWCYRMHQAGWSVIYLHDAVLYHYIGQCHLWSMRRIWIHHRSMLHFYRKHYSKSILFLDAAVAFGVVLRTLFTGILQRTGRKGTS